MGQKIEGSPLRPASQSPRRVHTLLPPYTGRRALGSKTPLPEAAQLPRDLSPRPRRVCSPRTVTWAHRCLGFTAPFRNGVPRGCPGPPFTADTRFWFMGLCWKFHQTGSGRGN